MKRGESSNKAIAYVCRGGVVLPPWHHGLGLTVQTHTLQMVCVCVLVLYRDFDEEVSGNYKKIYDVNASPSHIDISTLHGAVFQKGCEMTLLGLSMFLLVQNSNDMHETRNYNNCIHYKRAYCMYSIL